MFLNAGHSDVMADVPIRDNQALLSDIWQFAFFYYIFNSDLL